MWVIDTTDFCGMGIEDPNGKSWHAYDWGSNDGVNHRKSNNKITVWLHETQLPMVAMKIKRPIQSVAKSERHSGRGKILGRKTCRA